MSKFEVNYLKKKTRGMPILSTWISFMMVILICHYYFEIDIGKTYKMMHNNDQAEIQECA